MTGVPEITQTYIISNVSNITSEPLKYVTDHDSGFFLASIGRDGTRRRLVSVWGGHSTHSKVLHRLFARQIP